MTQASQDIFQRSEFGLVLLNTVFGTTYGEGEKRGAGMGFRQRNLQWLFGGNGRFGLGEEAATRGATRGARRSALSA